MSIMLDDPLHIPKEADGELLKKIMADSAALKCYYDQIFDYHFFSLDWQFST